MPDTPLTKTCPSCAEEIKAAAKICPHCRTRQMRYPILREIVPLGMVVLMLVGIIVAFAVMFPSASEGRDYFWHRRDLEVTHSTLAPRVKLGSYELSGFITNHGSYPWMAGKCEVRFVDSNGVLQDVEMADLNCIVPAKQECVFSAKLYDAPLMLTNGSLKRIIRVTSASDPRYSQ